MYKYFRFFTKTSVGKLAETFFLAKKQTRKLESDDNKIEILNKSLSIMSGSVRNVSELEKDMS